MLLKNTFMEDKNIIKTRKVPNTTIAEFAKTVDPDETAHLDLKCLPSSL